MFFHLSPASQTNENDIKREVRGGDRLIAGHRLALFPPLVRDEMR